MQHPRGIARPACSRAGRAGGGFTVIEMLLVMLILSLVAALALPTLGKAAHRLGDDATTQLVAPAAGEVLRGRHRPDLRRAVLPGSPRRGSARPPGTRRAAKRPRDDRSDPGSPDEPIHQDWAAPVRLTAMPVFAAGPADPGVAPGTLGPPGVPRSSRGGRGRRTRPSSSPPSGSTGTTP